MHTQGRSPDAESEALLTGWFNFAAPALLFARLRLYPDRIELGGLHLRGLYRRALAIRQVLQVDVGDDGALLVWLTTGETVRLRVRQPARWKHAIDACLTGASNR